jgi:ubiquitin carboxyl-terminal hydrolase 5/13
VAFRTIGLKSYPKILTLVAQRFTHENWVPKKSNIKLTWSNVSRLDLSFMHVACKENDVLMIDEVAKDTTETEGLLQLVSFGFSKGKAKKALKNTGNNLEAAMNWLMDHPEATSDDEDTCGPAADPGAIANLMDMGFSHDQAIVGLKETGNNMERAVEWLFSHPDLPVSTPLAEISSSGSEGCRSDVGEPKPYRLISFINHKGPSMHCGHYISHICLPDGRWVMLNDDRVVEQPNIVPLLQEAYVYFFARID